MDPDLVKTTELFLIPNSFLVAAVGTVDTDPHRAAVSLLGLLISALWLIASREATQEMEASRPNSSLSARARILNLLPFVFAFGWICSVGLHSALWAELFGS